jgi:hypothetical protein
MAIVSLAPAYVWDCNECGRENFQRAVSIVLDPDDDADADVLRSMHGISDGEPIPEACGGRVCARPDRVTCKHCGVEFKAVDCGAEDVEEDDD